MVLSVARQQLSLVRADFDSPDGGDERGDSRNEIKRNERLRVLTKRMCDHCRVANHHKIEEIHPKPYSKTYNDRHVKMMLVSQDNAKK